MRTDTITATHVNHGIAIAQLEGRKFGAAFMASRGVPVEVAVRVLCNPNARRPGDWK